MRSLVLLAILSSSLFVSAQSSLPPFNAADQPAAPDYSKESNWSALPFRTDAADKIPNFEQWVSDSLKSVDVFYIYPTLYMKGKTWNEDVSNKTLNKRIDTKPVQYQASVFNASARVYAPRYRQAIIDAFYKPEEGAKALAFAYEDVKRAFQYYLEHYNNGRPFIIASHSQGSYHARRLIKEMIDTTQQRHNMVAAYIIGMGVTDTLFKNIPICSSEKQTHCYVTWASYKSNYIPGQSILTGNVCVNPVTWTTDTSIAESARSKGALLLNFNKKYEGACSAQIHDNYLWVGNSLPLISSVNNLHIADYNLFWFDIRENVKKRIAAFD